MSEKIKKSWEGADERRKNTSELQSALGKERIGEKNPFYGKKHTDETKDKIKLTFEKRYIPQFEGGLTRLESLIKKGINKIKMAFAIFILFYCIVINYFINFLNIFYCLI